jgi:hypothetical protein
MEHNQQMDDLAAQVSELANQVKALAERLTALERWRACQDPLLGHLRIHYQ